MSTFQGLFVIRDGKPEDHNFVKATFLRGLYYGDSWFSLIPKPIFMAAYAQVIEALLQRRALKIACLPDDPDVILGYSILSKDFMTVDWVYVKTAWRRKGVARDLVPIHPACVTHLTELGKILLPKLNGAIFNPFDIT